MPTEHIILGGGEAASRLGEMKQTSWVFWRPPLSKGKGIGGPLCTHKVPRSIIPPIHAALLMISGVLFCTEPTHASQTTYHLLYILCGTKEQTTCVNWYLPPFYWSFVSCPCWGRSSTSILLLLQAAANSCVPFSFESRFWDVRLDITTTNPPTKTTTANKTTSMVQR